MERRRTPTVAAVSSELSETPFDCGYLLARAVDSLRVRFQAGAPVQIEHINELHAVLRLVRAQLLKIPATARAHM